MKSIIALLVIFMSQAGLAQQLVPRVELQPGTSLELLAYQRTLVTCGSLSAPTNQVPPCLIKANNGNFAVSAGANYIESKYYIEDAISSAKALKVAGLCGTDPYQAPVCSVKNESGSYRVYMGADAVKGFYNLQDAVNLVASLRAETFCR